MLPNEGLNVEIIMKDEAASYEFGDCGYFSMLCIYDNF